METEARSCSMDFGCITPLYVYRMWGGEVSLKEIKSGFVALRKQDINSSLLLATCILSDKEAISWPFAG